MAYTKTRALQSGTNNDTDHGNQDVLSSAISMPQEEIPGRTNSTSNIVDGDDEAKKACTRMSDDV